MKIVEFIKKEFEGWGKYERIIFPLEILLIVLISIYMKDKTAALISAICGICATILAGKGKISCYFFGMMANICYSYISFKNSLWGNLGLNMLYYFPMQFVGIAKWKNHLKKETQEIYKTSFPLTLSLKIVICFSVIVLLGCSSIKHSYPLFSINSLANLSIRFICKECFGLAIFSQKLLQR